jgi:hypothetical protein
MREPTLHLLRWCRKGSAPARLGAALPLLLCVLA